MSIKNRRWTKWLIIPFWVFLIGISLTAPNKLNRSFALSINLTYPNTQSGKGQALYVQRFNLTSQTATQVLIIELNNGSNILSPQWQNFTLYLTLYLNQTYFPRNYTRIMSEPLALQAGLTDIANPMVSKDHTDGLIYMSGLQNNLNPNKDVKDIRDQMKALIADPTPY